jgi:hypothetical protein
LIFLDPCHIGKVLHLHGGFLPISAFLLYLEGFRWCLDLPFEIPDETGTTHSREDNGLDEMDEDEVR